ncbi:MAG: DUF4168 domain-containing protein [Magnetospirillum sp.]|nr:DUF4168 domain-containing protein [Magnetospirillum sp.]
MMRFPFAAALLGAALVAAAPAIAVEQSTPATPQEEPAAATPDDGELSAFVAAFLRLIGVQHGYMMVMRDEQDPARLEEIKQSALMDMKSAVEQDGMTVDRYNQIALSVRDDPGLRDRVEGMLQQLAAEPSGPAPQADEE